VEYLVPQRRPWAGVEVPSSYSAPALKIIASWLFAAAPSLCLEITMTETILYRAFDRDGRLLYVGITKDFHLRQNHHKLHRMWAQEAIWTLESYPSRELALAAEAVAIRSEHPLFNVQHKLRLKLEPVEPEVASIEEFVADQVVKTGDSRHAVFHADLYRRYLNHWDDAWRIAQGIANETDRPLQRCYPEAKHAFFQKVDELLGPRGRGKDAPHCRAALLRVGLGLSEPMTARKYQDKLRLRAVGAEFELLAS
jgi:hypothetical protein